MLWPITTLTPKACFTFRADVANSGAAAINYQGLGAIPIVKTVGGITTPLVDNDIRAGMLVHTCYDGTNMQCQNCTGNVPTGGGAPLAARYWVSDADAVLSNELDLSTLASCLLLHVVAGGISTPGCAVAGNDYTSPTGNEDLSLKRLAPRLLELSAASGTVAAPNANKEGADVYYRHNIAGALTIPCPTGSPVNQQRLVFELKPATTPQTLTFTTGTGCFSGAGGLPLPTTTGDSTQYVRYTYVYSTIPNLWLYSGGTKSTAPCSLADGCTGSALSDPGGHRLLGWDDTDNQVKFLTLAGCTYNAPTDTWTCGGGVRSLDIPAGNLDVSGGCATNAPAALLTNGPKVTTVSCTDTDTDSFEFTFLSPDGWDAGTITIELDVFYTGTTHNTQTFDVNFSGQCVSAGDVVAAWAITSGATAESTSNVEAVVTASGTANRVLHATTAALTLAGTCAAGDRVYVHGLVDAGGTTFTPMSDLRIQGLKVEWNRIASD